MPSRTRVIGVDVGATLCKVAALDAPAEGVHFASEALSDVRAHVIAQRPERVGVTGGGAPALRAALTSVPTMPVGEFDAWAAGAPVLAAADGVPLADRYLLASVGTGTSVLAVGDGPPRRVGGTAVGGGSLMGLGRLLVGAGTFGALTALAAVGDRREVDLLVGDVYRDMKGPLVGDLTAANFGKLRSTHPPDLAAALVNLVGETVALVSTALARGAGIETIVYCGSTLETNPTLVQSIDDITRRFGAVPQFLTAGAYCGAVGAAAVARRS